MLRLKWCNSNKVFECIWDALSGGRQTESIELAEVLERLPIDRWSGAMRLHLNAVAAACDELQMIEQMLRETRGVESEEEPSLELIATVMTIHRNLEALLEELEAAKSLLLGSE